jgi:hypothetical protein
MLFLLTSHIQKFRIIAIVRANQDLEKNGQYQCDETSQENAPKDYKCFTDVFAKSRISTQ